MDETALTRTVGEAWRALVPRPSGLRRGSDRVELASRWVVLLAVLLTIPVVLAFGSAVADRAEQRGALARATRHPVAAVVVAAPAPTSPDGTAAGPAGRPDRAWVRWSGRDGATHTEATPLPASMSPGSRTEIWVDDAERVVARPPAADAGWIAGAVAALVALCSVLLVAHLVVRSVRWLLDRGRLRDWEREWAVVGRLGRGSAR